MILQNRYGTSTAELVVATAGTYEHFDAADLGTPVFSTSQLGIGSKWRLVVALPAARN